MHTHIGIQITALLVTLGVGKSLKLDVFKQRCCSNSLSPTPREPQTWADTLREATYRSITQHLDYSGTLDGRLDRDHTLWKLLQQASFTPPSQPLAETNDGVLVEKLHSNQVAFEFRQICIPGLCDPKNDSVVAVWRVRRSENPHVMWVQIKLPKIKDHLIEDVYEYRPGRGLKKLNPDPIYNSFGSEKTHRFSISKEKSNFRSDKRMDFGKIFGIGRVTPTSFVYDSPIVSGKSEDGWIVSQPRRPHPAVILDTGTKSVNANPPYHPNSPFTVTGPKGYHHVIHSFPSIPPPQNLDHQSHDIGGFLPSVGPVSAPPYQMDFVYDPRYLVYYNNRPNHPSRYQTQPPRQFKPSTEFVHYSEVDPFYHPNGERDMLTTTPLPFKNFHSTGYPQSINDQLPTNSPIENTRPPFQIIVGDVKSSQHTTTSKPISFKKPLTSTEKPKNRFSSRQRTTSTEGPTTEENITTKPFGEKIKPKTLPPISNTTPRSREKLTTKTFQESSKKKVNLPNTEKRNKVRTNPRPNNFTKQPPTLKGTTIKMENVDTSTFKNYATISTQPIELFETTESVATRPTEESGTKTTNLNTETIEELNTKYLKEIERFTEDKPDTTTELSLNLPETGITEFSAKQKVQTDTEPTSEDYPNDGTTTEVYNETTTTKSSGIDDFFSTLTETMFSTQTTMEKSVETTTNVTRKTSADSLDADTQESKQQNYRLVTFPGDTVSIIANRISKSVSYRTAKGKEGRLKTRKHPESRYKYSDAYKDYSTIL